MIKLSKDQRGIAMVIEIGVLVVLISAIAFTVWRVQSSNDEVASQSSNETIELTEVLPTDLGTLFDVGEIKTSAEADYSASVLGIELEFEDGVLIYSVHLSDGSVHIFNALSGVHLELSDDGDDDLGDNDALPENFLVNISINEAIDIAKVQRPNSVVEKVELELEDEEVVFSVRFTDESRVDVDVLTGDIEKVVSENGFEIEPGDDDFDDDGIENDEDDDDDNDGIDDDEDDDDDNDGIDDDEDDDDDNDGIDDDEDSDNDEEELS